MPTIELFSPPIDPNAWHAVGSPGGFEWWQFLAWDASSDTHLFIDLVEGDPLNRQYLNRFARYLKNPTKCPPPLPGEFPRASVTVCTGGKSFRKDVRSAMVSSAESLRLSVGSVSAHAEQGGVIRVLAMLKGLELDLSFSPLAGRLGVVQQGASLRWILPSSRFGVTGKLSIDGQPRPFNGNGLHDHCVSTQPLRPMDGGLRWFRFRIPQEKVTYVLSMVDAAHGQLAGIKLVAIDSTGVHEVPMQKVSMQYSRSFYSGIYPETLSVGDRIKLFSPRVIDKSGPLRLIYKSVIDGVESSAIAELLL